MNKVDGKINNSAVCVGTFLENYGHLVALTDEVEQHSMIRKRRRLETTPNYLNIDFYLGEFCGD